MSGGDARRSREAVMTYGNSMILFSLSTPMIHRDLKDRMLYPQSRFFRIFSF
jgi:hypothetical protein